MNPVPVVADANAIGDATNLLRQGRLVAFPTETVYGLGADASNPELQRRGEARILT
ncbi:MAG: Sua5/YciO/YrdC/YwlC family protein [Methylobacter sp.]|nr:Sua5/YciO/YrdC/YwlC family protein [Methylobacter sp.]